MKPVETQTNNWNSNHSDQDHSKVQHSSNLTPQAQSQHKQQSQQVTPIIPTTSAAPSTYQTQPLIFLSPSADSDTLQYVFHSDRLQSLCPSLFHVPISGL